MQETQEMRVLSLGGEDSLEQGTPVLATHSSILTWRIPWTEEPGRPQSTASESDMTEHSPTKKLLWGFLGHMTFSDSTGKFTTGYTTYDCGQTLFLGFISLVLSITLFPSGQVLCWKGTEILLLIITTYSKFYGGKIRVWWDRLTGRSRSSLAMTRWRRWVYSRKREVKQSAVKVSQSCPTLCDPMDCIVHGILQARILEWVAFPFSRGSSQPRDRAQVSHIEGRFFTSWATRDAAGRQNYVFFLALELPIFTPEEASSLGPWDSDAPPWMLDEMSGADQLMNIGCFDYL